jgi:hypothetical protein
MEVPFFKSKDMKKRRWALKERMNVRVVQYKCVLCGTDGTPPQYNACPYTVAADGIVVI